MSQIQSIGQYRIEADTLGKGNFAVVELATHAVSNTKVAIKVIDLRKIKEDYVKRNLNREAKVLSQLRHPNIIRLYETIKSTSLYCLVTEYAAGGDMLSLVRRQRGGRLTEASARPYVRQLVSALHHMHERSVVHRDLKMENIMLDAKHKNIKIVDFGLSTTYDSDQKLNTHCGSADYAAPELFVSGQNYGPEVDIWSMGICMYAMVTGHLPFSTPHSENRRLYLLQQIQFGLGPRHDTNLQHVSSECKELLKACIEPNPELRIPLLDIELHHWLTNHGKELFKSYRQQPKDKDVSKTVIEKMAEYLKLPFKQISKSVHDYRLDEFGGLYNILLDEQMKKKCGYDGDHTLRKPTVHQTRVKLNGSEPKVKESNKDIQNTSRPKTPAVVGLVKYNNQVLSKQPIDKLYFELAVLNNRETNRRPRTAICPPTGNKTKPIGNATTVNNVIARNYNNRNDKKYQRPKTTATCQPTRALGQPEIPRKQLWEHSTPVPRNKANTPKPAKKIQKQKQVCPTSQATLAMLAAVDIADVGEDMKCTVAGGIETEPTTDVDNAPAQNTTESTATSVLRPTFTNKFRVTPSPEMFSKKSVQFDKDTKLPIKEHGMKEMTVIYMNKSFKHGYQLSRTATIYDKSEDISNVNFNEFKPKLTIKLNESRGNSGLPRDVSVEDPDNRVDSTSKSSTSSTPTDKPPKPPTRHSLQASNVSMKSGSNCVLKSSWKQTHFPVRTPNNQSSMPQRICWKKRSVSDSNREMNDKTKVKVISKNKIYQMIPESDIRVVSQNHKSSNRPRRTLKQPPPARTNIFKMHMNVNNRDSMKKYTGPKFDNAPSDCSSVICKECQQAGKLSSGLRMFQLLRDATPCSCGETSSMCSHKQESLHEHVNRVNRGYRDQLSSKRNTSTSPKVLSKQAINMLRSKVKHSNQVQPRSMKYKEADIVTIVTKPPVLQSNGIKNDLELGKTRLGTEDDNKCQLKNQVQTFGYELERKISNAFKEGHVISKMRRTPDSFALLDF